MAEWTGQHSRQTGLTGMDSVIPPGGGGGGGGHFTYILMGMFHGDRSFGGNKCCDILILRGNMC